MEEYKEEKFKVGCSPLTSTIYAGKILKDGSWGANKKDVTNSAVNAVAQHLLQLNEKMEFDYRGERYEIKVNKVIKNKVHNKYWDINCVDFPEDGYDLEKEAEFVIGKEFMFKKEFIRCSCQMLDDLFKEIEHGDNEHRKWLKDKIEDFKSKNINE